MKRRKNTPEGKKLATILCEASDEETLESVGELILSLALPNLGEGEQEIISDAEIGGGITPIVSFIRFYVWNPKGRAKALDAFATELARLFSSSPKVYVIHAKYAMGGVYVEVICRKVAASHSSWKRYIKMFSHGMQIYSGQKQNPKRRKNSQESDALEKLICSSSKPSLRQALELIPLLWEGNSDSITKSWTFGQQGIWFKFDNHADAYDMFKYYSKFFALNMKIAIVFEKDPRQLNVYTVYILCWSPTNPTMQWIQGQARNGFVLLRIGGQDMSNVPPKRRNSGQYARQLADLICSKNRDMLRQGAEFIMTLYDTDWDKTQLRMGGANDSIRWRFYHDKTEATKLYKFLGQYFTSEKRISVYLQYTKQANSYNVIIDCQKASRSKYNYISKMKDGKESKGQKVQAKHIFNPRRRKNSGQYARELADILCGGEAPSALELVKSLYDADWDNIFTQALKARKELRFDFHHDVTDLSAVRPFVQYWKQYFANDPRVYVFAHSATTYKGTRVYISCSRSKVGPIKRKNSGHLPPISLGKKLEALLCSKGDATLDQFGDLIRSFFPDIHTFTHWGNLFGSADVDFDFSKVSKADEFEKWAKKAFSKKIDIWKPTAHSVGLICQGITIRNPKRRRNSSHLPPTSLGKKLEPLLCSKDDATREQFGDLIRSFFPDIHNFIHLENPLGFGSADFDFSKVSKADEFEKWAKKAFSKNIYIWRPFFTNKTVWLTCRSRTIPNPKRRRNTKGRDLGYGTNNGSMVKNQLKSIHRIAKELDDALYGTDRLPDWVQSKVTVALDRLVVAQNYLLSKLEGYKGNPKCNVNSAIIKGKEACKLIRANKSTK